MQKVECVGKQTFATPVTPPRELCWSCSRAEMSDRISMTTFNAQSTTVNFLFTYRQTALSNQLICTFFSKRNSLYLVCQTTQRFSFIYTT